MPSFSPFLQSMSAEQRSTLVTNLEGINVHPQMSVHSSLLLLLLDHTGSASHAETQDQASAVLLADFTEACQQLRTAYTECQLILRSIMEQAQLIPDTHTGSARPDPPQQTPSSQYRHMDALCSVANTLHSQSDRAYINN